MSSDLREAAERLRRFALDLLEIHGDGPYRTGAAQRAVELARAYLAEHPADEDEPADILWMAGLLQEAAGNFRYQRQFVIRGPVYVHVAACEGGWRYELWCRDEKIKDAPTRGDVRRLCLALGIPLKETP